MRIVCRGLRMSSSTVSLYGKAKITATGWQDPTYPTSKFDNPDTRHDEHHIKAPTSKARRGNTWGSAVLCVLRADNELSHPPPRSDLRACPEIRVELW